MKASLLIISSISFRWPFAFDDESIQPIQAMDQKPFAPTPFDISLFAVAAALLTPHTSPFTQNFPFRLHAPVPK